MLRPLLRRSVKKTVDQSSNICPSAQDYLLEDWPNFPPVCAGSTGGVALLFRLVGEYHDPRRTGLGVDQLQINLLLDVVEERLAIPQNERVD